MGGAKGAAMLKDNLRKYREARGLSQQQLADELHVVRQTVSKWERGTSAPDADLLVALARAFDVTPNELLGASTPVGKDPRDLAWETALLGERVASESRRIDHIAQGLKWALAGAVALALVLVVTVWLPNQQFSNAIWWDGPTDNPNYNAIVYRMGSEEKTLRLFLDPQDYERVISCAGEPGMAEAMGAAGLLGKPGSLEALSEKANRAIEEAGGTVLRHELWIPDLAKSDEDPTNDDMPCAITYFTAPEEQ